MQDFSHLNDLEGLHFMPVKENKRPIVVAWTKHTNKHDLSNCYGVGLVCGSLSGGLEVIDIDCKYDLTGKMFDRYKRLINEVNPELLKKLVVQETISGGYHFLYRCSAIAGNLKLANRSTTEQEKENTYQQEYAYQLSQEKEDDEAKKIAQKAKDADKIRVLFETRGQGGYIMCFPSKGYALKFGDYYSIATITPEERDTLHSIARQFNEITKEVTVPKSYVAKKQQGSSPFEDYNNRGDVVGLLESYGWKVVGQKGNKTIFLRPGQTTSQSSGNYDHEKKWFSVFTTSSEFEPEHAYQPYAVFAVLECNKDFSEASKKLYEQGYGERFESNVEKPKAPSTRQIPSRINSDDDDYSFLAKPEDYNGYLQQVIDGTLPQGLTTGSPELDKFFLFKEADLFMCNGHDNVGKSAFVWWLLLLASMYHGWKGIIFSSENTLGGFMRKMIQFYWGKQLRGDYAMTDQEFKIAKEFIEKHFTLIKAQEDLYNYKDILNMVKKASKKQKYNYGMIDPYNSLKTDLSGYSKLSTHDYHYEAISEIKSYGQINNFGWFINHHAVTAALRLKDGEKKYPVAPQKADTEGGGKFGNKADTFASIHRLLQHPTDWKITEFHVRKMRDTDTGGRVTPFDSPVKFEMYKGGCGFIEHVDGFGMGKDPVAEWHKLNGRQLEINIPEQRLPYKDSDDERSKWLDPTAEDKPF